MTRQELVLSGVDWRKGKGLEIGPLTSPILSKDEANIFYVDHMSQQGLREKYKDAPLDINDIVPVDFVVSDSLKKAVGDKKFDYVIACHVIEHIPDTIRWFQDIASALKPSGLLALAIPDKRYTFDIERQPSTPGSIVGAYLESHKLPSSAQMYDFAVEARHVKAADAWREPHKNWVGNRRLHTLDEAYELCMKNLAGEYIDGHCHVFTPRSFIKVMDEVMKLGLFDFEVTEFRDTNDQNIEFYVTLRKSPKGKDRINRQLASLPEPPKEETRLSIHKEKLALEEKISALENELLLLRNSRSWKITRPLRSVMGRLSASE